MGDGQGGISHIVEPALGRGIKVKNLQKSVNDGFIAGVFSGVFAELACIAVKRP